MRQDKMTDEVTLGCIEADQREITKKKTKNNFVSAVVHCASNTELRVWDMKEVSQLL